MSIQERIAELGIEIPRASKPVANYVGARRVGKIIYVSGQLPIEDGKIKYIGKVGENISVEDAQKAAKLCALNVLSQLSAVLSDDLDAIESCVKLGIFVNAVPEFEDHPTVANGASDFIVHALGNVGIHARAAIGCSSLPKGVCAEVEAIFTIK